MNRPRYDACSQIPQAVPNCNTIEDLDRYLSKNPRPAYRLVSVLYLSGTFYLVWELKDGVE